ncbi:MAG: hypothetical protein IPQ07_41500 [Myxococcales bacterium]|nr:hypothetical protein [Myxococcales bacterium]
MRRARVPGGGRDLSARDRDHLVLTVPAAQQRLWSPWLTIDITPRDGGSHLFARFSPHPSVWTGFAFGYLTFGVVLLFSLIFAGAHAMVGGELWPFQVSAGALLVLGAMWGASRVGQQLARGQMTTLRHELERAIETCKATGET